MLALVAVDWSVAAPGAHYGLFPEPEEHWSADHRTTYVLDKQTNRFWVCTVRSNFHSACRSSCRSDHRAHFGLMSGTNCTDRASVNCGNCGGGCAKALLHATAT